MKYCFCGMEQVGRKLCSDGRRCPRQSEGNGHWHIALPHLQNMPSLERARRYPGLRLRSLGRHVDAQGIREAKRKSRNHERYPHDSARRVWRRPRTKSKSSSSRSRKGERHPHPSGSASSSSLQLQLPLREVFGPKADAAEKSKPTFLEPESKKMPGRVWRKVRREPVAKEETKCYCGGEFKARMFTADEPHGSRSEPECSLADCPRALLGFGSWHAAWQKLREHEQRGHLKRLYPKLRIDDLKLHVEELAEKLRDSNRHPVHQRRLQQDREDCKVEDDDGASEHSEDCKVEDDDGASEHSKDCKDGDDDAASTQTMFTVLSSDDSQASIFDLRGRIHSTDGEWTEGEESLVSADNEDGEAERQAVAKWRDNECLQDDQDFAFVYVDFNEAYSGAGRAVAMAWARCRQRAELSLSTDAVHVSRISASIECMKAIDDIKKKKKAKAMANSKPLRHPGQGIQGPELESDKQRFFQSLVKIMKEGEAFRQENSNASDKEYTDSLERRAQRICNEAEVPTLHRAVTTADELREWMEERKDGTSFLNLQAIVLEGFIWQSKAKTRVVTALGWLCKHLGFSWPLSQIEKPKIGRGNSALGMETRQTPAAQPVMLNHLEVVMRASCLEDDPTWTALLATWLQTAGCLRLGHIIRRSVPVERYDGWILFFCKRGKQKHNRQGFYWGVPSETSNGWDWATPFLDLYMRKRVTVSGKSLMGSIFRADDFQHFTPRAVNLITQAAMNEVVENPQLLGTYSWRRYLPTMGLAANCSKKERLALGDWQDKELIQSDAPITLRYAEGKAGASRTIKTKLAKVQGQLRTLGIKKFEDIDELTWKDLLEKAAAEVSSAPLMVGVLWRNPDVTMESREFEIRDDFRTPMENFNMPKMISGMTAGSTKGIYLTATSRGGDTYCPLFQQGTCHFPLLGDSSMALSVDGEKNLSFGSKCKLGDHRCAALCRGGRSCNGNHPGKDCRNKKHWKPDTEADAAKIPLMQIANAPDAADLQLVRPFGPIDSDQPAKKAKVSKPSEVSTSVPDSAAEAEIDRSGIDHSAWMTAVKDSSIMDGMMDELMKKKQRYPGRRMQPESPTMIAKVCAIGGELWMGPVPTKARLQMIMKMEPSIQICCFKKSPTDVRVDDADPDSQGMLLPDTEFHKLEMSNDGVRKQDLRMLRTNLLTSMRQGDNAYIHCMTGLCRAAIGGALLASVLMDEEISCSASRVDDLRNVQMEKAWNNMGGPWMDRIIGEECVVHPETNFYLVGLNRPSKSVVHAGVAGAEDYPLCKWKRGGKGVAPKEHMQKCEQPEEARCFSDTFCKACWPKLPASGRVKVQKVFST